MGLLSFIVKNVRPLSEQANREFVDENNCNRDFHHIGKLSQDVYRKVVLSGNL